MIIFNNQSILGHSSPPIITYRNLGNVSCVVTFRNKSSIGLCCLLYYTKSEITSGAARADYSSGLLKLLVYIHPPILITYILILDFGSSSNHSCFKWT